MSGSALQHSASGGDGLQVRRGAGEAEGAAHDAFTATAGQQQHQQQRRHDAVVDSGGISRSEHWGRHRQSSATAADNQFDVCRRRLYDVRSSDSVAGWLGSRVASVLDSGAEGLWFKSQPRRCRVTVLGKLFTPIVCLFTHQAAKLVAALLRVARVTAGLAESNGSLLPGL